MKMCSYLGFNPKGQSLRHIDSMNKLVCLEPRVHSSALNNCRSCPCHIVILIVITNFLHKFSKCEKLFSWTWGYTHYQGLFLTLTKAMSTAYTFFTSERVRSDLSST